jgi:hypothetical protein
MDEIESVFKSFLMGIAVVGWLLVEWKAKAVRAHVC